MYQFSSGLVCGLLGVCALGLVTPETGSNPRPLDNANYIGATVNRAAKADRLSSDVTQASQAWKTEFNARIKGRTGNDAATNSAAKANRENTQVPDEMPIGCEPAVSAVLDDMLAKIPSRCVSSLFASEILPG